MISEGIAVRPYRALSTMAGEETDPWIRRVPLFPTQSTVRLYRCHAPLAIPPRELGRRVGIGRPTVAPFTPTRPNSAGSNSLGSGIAGSSAGPCRLATQASLTAQIAEGLPNSDGGIRAGFIASVR